MGLGDSVDTLGRWMAHHVAELVAEAEAATDNDRDTKQALLRDAVLALWAHRFELPTGKRPFGEFEPILRTLADLDPENPSPRHFPLSRAPDNETDESKETREWIELARSLDYTAKLLIGDCLASATDAAADKASEWVRLVEKAAIEDSFDLRVIRLVERHRDLMTDPDPDAYERRVLVDRKERLDSFVSLASMLANEIATRLNSLPPAVDESNEESDQ